MRREHVAGAHGITQEVCDFALAIGLSAALTHPAYPVLCAAAESAVATYHEVFPVGEELRLTVSGKGAQTRERR